MNVTLRSSNELLMQLVFPWCHLSPILPLLRPLPATWGQPFQAVGRSLHFFIWCELMISSLPSPGSNFMPGWAWSLYFTCCRTSAWNSPHTLRRHNVNALLLWRTWLHCPLFACLLLWVKIFSFPFSRNQVLNILLPFSYFPLNLGKQPCLWTVEPQLSPWSCKSVWGDGT